MKTLSTPATLELTQDNLTGIRGDITQYEYETPTVEEPIGEIDPDALYEAPFGVGFYDDDMDIYVDDDGVEHRHYDGNAGDVINIACETRKQAEVEAAHADHAYPGTKHFVVEQPRWWGWELTYVDHSLAQLRKVTTPRKHCRW